MEIIKIYTDGSCDARTRNGGYAYIIENEKGILRKSYGPIPDTTSQRAELIAIIKSLESLNEPSEVILMSDSSYALKGISEWMQNWQNSGWRVKNADLWKQIWRLNIIHTIFTRHIKGHNGDFYNEECDKMANLARKNI